MFLRNYQEDIVINLINIALEDHPDLKSNGQYINDIAAYTLNRIPPAYITGERGFTRFACDYLIDDEDVKNESNLINIMTIIYRGIERVRKRRKSINESRENDIETDFKTYIHNFPQIIGRVLDAHTHNPIEDCEVTLLIDNKEAESQDSSWLNPYWTKKVTNGYYSFWPKAFRSEIEQIETGLKVIYNHEEYSEKEYTQKLKTSGAFFVKDIFTDELVLNFPLIFLNRK